MAGYGFRLYTVKLVTGTHKSRAVDFSQSGARSNEHVSVWVRRLFKRLESYDPLTGPPIFFTVEDEDAPPPISDYVREPVRGEYRTNFVSHSPAPMTRINFKLHYGRTGKVSVGVQDTGPMPLGHIPTGDEYRGILYLPEDGEHGLLALESVPSAPNPQRMLNRWLARAAIDLQAEELAALELLTPEERAGASPKPFKLNFNQYPNLDRIEKAVETNSAAKVVLKKNHVDGAATASDDDIVLSSTLGQGKRKQAAGVAGRLYRRATGKLKEDEDEATIDDLEDLVDGSLDGIEWTEGYIQIEDESGLKKIGLDHIDKFFIYPSGSSTPLSDAGFEKSVATVVVDLQSVLGIQLDLA